MPVDYNAQARIAYLSWLSSSDVEEQAWVRTLREYAAGEHPLYITDRMQEFVGLKARDSEHPYAHNLCQLVIDAVTERLEVTGFEAAGDPPENPPANSLSVLAQGWWEANRMDAEQDVIYEAACRDGDTFLIVDWDVRENKPVWYQNDAYDGTQGVALHYDPSTGDALFAAKKWQIYDPYNKAMNGRTRMTLYFPDRVEKYISSIGNNTGIGGSQWEPFYDVQGEAWPIPWLDSAGQPLGIAAIAFENPGGSEISQLVPIQDMLNKADIDLIAATDVAGFRILWASGVPPQTDATTGDEKSITLSPGKMIRLTDPSAKLSSIEPIDPGLLIQSSKYWIESAAGITRTPQYLFQAIGADQPSGESLKQQEIGLVHKCQRRQKVWGNAWEDVIYLSAKLYDMYNAPAHIPAELQTQWEDAAMTESDDVIELRAAQTLQAYVAAGLPLEAGLQRVGWSEEDIEEAMASKQAESERQQVTLGAALARAQRQFDQNTPPTEGVGPNAGT